MECVRSSQRNPIRHRRHRMTVIPTLKVVWSTVVADDVLVDVGIEPRQGGCQLKKLDPS
jgi:hypothetical protein